VKKLTELFKKGKAVSDTEKETEVHPLQATIDALARLKTRCESLELALTQQTEATAELNNRLTTLEAFVQAATANAVKDVESFLQRVNGTDTEAKEENPAVIG